VSNSDRIGVPTAHRLVTSSMTSRDCMTSNSSQSSKSTHLETIGNGSTIRAEPLRTHLTTVEHRVEYQFIRLRTLTEEAFGASAVLSKFDNFHDKELPPPVLQRAM